MSQPLPKKVPDELIVNKPIAVVNYFQSLTNGAYYLWEQVKNLSGSGNVSLLNTVKDLTSATEDYALSVNETAKIDISAASTALNIAVEDGVYELHITFDPDTFAADQVAALLPNGAAQTNEIFRNSASLSESIATDEFDVDFTNADDRFFFSYDVARICSIKAALHKFGAHAYSQSSTIVRTLPGGATLLHTYFNHSYWPSASDWTSLGTLEIGEAATGVCYVKRIA